MSEFEFALATPADDAALRQLLRDNPVPGAMTIAYERDPSYFLGCSVMGPFCQTLVVRHRPSGALAGLASRAVRPLFVNGTVHQVGYLGQLRIDRRFRSRWLVSSGFRLLRRLHEDRRVAGYLTTIIDGSREAQGILAQHPRTGFPCYRPIDRLHTLAIRPQPFKRTPSVPLAIRSATLGDRERLVAFLQQHGATRQFFPLLAEADLLPGATATRNLSIEDFLVAEQSGTLCGAMALWDQSAFKQPVVCSYSGTLRWSRPFYNGYARCRGWQPLPAPGGSVPLVYAAFACVSDNDREIYRRLLEGLSAIAHARGFSRILVGLTESDPLLAVARRFSHLPYVSTLYTVCWPEEDHFHAQLDGRVNHVEIATL